MPDCRVISAPGRSADSLEARAVVAALLGIALLAASPLPVAAEAGEKSAADLAGLSLTELLSLQLDAMSTPAVHHTHDAGEWMVGYSFKFMSMEGNRSGTHRRNTGDVFAKGFMVAPTSMDTRMHMFHLMYAPTDRLTLMLMMPYVRKSMDHLVNPALPVPFAGVRFTTRSEGPGDLKVSGLWSLFRNESHRLIVQAGAGFPTGSIDEKDNLPNTMGAKVRLPYPMQLGSGTYDFLPGLTYLGQTEKWTWGAHASGTVRFGKNKHDYRLGNQWLTTAWGARGLTRWLSASLRFEATGWGNIHGADSALVPTMVPTADPNRRAGTRIDTLLGLNLFTFDLFSDERFSRNRIAVEGGLPVYQSLDGPQLEMDWRMSVSWNWTF